MLSVPRRVLFVIGFATLASACNSDTKPEVPSGVEVAASPQTLNAIGDSAKLTVDYVTKNGRRPVSGGVAWRSLTPSILSVTSDGFAISRLVGTGRVEVTVGAFKDTAIVNVQQILASLTTTWRAETLFVDDTISVVVGGRDSNDVAMPLPEQPSIESVTGVAVTKLSGLTVTAAQPGDSRITLRVAKITTDVSLNVETPFIGVTAGDGFSCGLVSRGAVYCWGLFGPPAMVMRPRTVPGLPPISAIDAGTSHVCALTTSGEVYCWGHGFTPYDGIQRMALPQQVIAVSAGYDFSCALAADGASYCWGWNQDGQVGVEPTGPGAAQPAPVRTSAPPLSSISAGTMIACGVANGTIVCWGSGFGSTPHPLASTASFKSVSVGTGICGITTQDQPLCLTGPVTDLTSVGTVTQLSTGNGWACALHADASAECWGQNYFGQLGTGTRSDATLVGPGTVVGNIPFGGVSAGTGLGFPGQHSCGVALEGRAYCWGENTAGQLGSPLSEPYDNYRLRMVPTRVTRILPR